MEYSSKDSLEQCEPQKKIGKAMTCKNDSSTNTVPMTDIKDSLSKFDLSQPYVSELEVDSVTEDLKETIVMDSESESIAVDYVETIIEDHNSSITSIGSFKDGNISPVDGVIIPEDGYISSEALSKSYTSSRSSSRTDTRSSFDSECTLSCDLTENVVNNVANNSQSLEERSIIENIANNTKSTLQECNLEAPTSFSRSSSRIGIGYSIDLESTLMCDLADNIIHTSTQLEERNISDNVENDLKISEGNSFTDNVILNPQLNVLEQSPISPIPFRDDSSRTDDQSFSDSDSSLSHDFEGF